MQHTSNVSEDILSSRHLSLMMDQENCSVFRAKDSENIFGVNDHHIYWKLTQRHYY
jgi:hypothetical protein